MPRDLRILIIEDCISTYDVLVRKLVRSGLSVTAERVETEDKMYTALLQPWDVIVSDNMMPKFNGLTALDIRNQKVPTIPFVMFSGEITQEQIKEAMKNGCNRFIMKGNFELVVETINLLITQGSIRLLDSQ